LPSALAWSALARLVAGQRAYAARALEPLWRDVEAQPFRTTLALLEAFRGVAQELGGARLLVLVFPPRPDLERLLAGGERYWTTLAAALEARGIGALDLSEALLAEARAAGGVGGLYLQSHFSPRANECVARAVLAELALGAR
jgi:hypothetical protein